jgi:predicted nucleotidyltransferase
MSLFFRYPNVDFTLSEVAKNTKLSKATVSKIIKAMKQLEFVTILDLGVVYRIRANAENPLYKKEKIAYNVTGIMRSNIAEFLIKEFKSPKCIILYGSYRKGDDDEDSDIDIAVEVPEGVETGIFEYKEFRELEDFANRKVAVHVFNRKEVDANVFMSIANGIVLYGLLEVSK